MTRLPDDPVRPGRRARRAAPAEPSAPLDRVDVPTSGTGLPTGGTGLPDGAGEAPSVRPYTVTGGRTGPAGTYLPVEALVEGLVDPATGLRRAEVPAEARSSATYAVPRLPDPVAAARAALAGPETRRILELTAGRYLSVAEVSAHAHLPVGVVRVLVGDLLDSGAVRVHVGTTSPTNTTSPTGQASQTGPADPTDASGRAAARAVLESVLDGICAL